MKNTLIHFLLITVFVAFVSCEKEDSDNVPTETTSVIPQTTAGRQNVKQGCIETNSRTATISLWDHGQIDGDIVSFYVNGKKVVSEITLNGPSNKYTFDITLDNNGYNSVSLFAHNLGDLPPNTAAMSINGNQSTIQSTLETNGSYDVVITGFGVSCSGGNGDNTGGGSNSGGSTNTGGGSTNTASNNGNIAFYTTRDRGCGSISITVDGNTTRRLSQFFPQGINDCNQGAVFSLTPGRHTFSASCGQYSWNSSFNITAGGCLRFNLQ